MCMAIFDFRREEVYMKIAVISDIHSNVFALKAILEHIDNENVDRIINLGDTLLGMIDPIGTANLLMSRSDIVHVMGNGDELLLQEDVDSISYTFTKPLLDKKIIRWLSNFNDSYEIDNMIFIHGSPWSKYDYLLSTVSEEGIKDKTLLQLDNELGSLNANYIFCGHDHKCRTLITPKGKTIINPGSVGLPAYSDNLPFHHKIESGTNFAKYSVVMIDENKITKVSHNEVLYDWDTASKIAKLNGSLDYAIPILTGRI